MVVSERDRAFYERARLFLQRPDRLEKEFQRHARKWATETAFVSSVTDLVMHPSYQRIMAMGPQVLPLILRDLQEQPKHWFWALSAIAGEDVAKAADTFDGAVNAWLAWGKRKGYIN